MRIAYLFLLAFASWTVLFWYHYVHNIEQVCVVPNSPVTELIPDPIPNNSTVSKPLLFEETSFEPILDLSIQEFIDNIIQQSNEDQKLQITGFYSPTEQSGLDYDLGLARASELKKMLLNELPEDRIEIFTDTISNFILYKNDLIEAVTYEWVDGYEPETVPADYYLLEHDTKVVKVEDFQSLIERIGERLKLSGETIIIRGHTDSNGDDEYNFKIAHRNAKKIRDVLRKLGVDRNKIKTSSQGEDVPVADNETEMGRLENRRIEIEIIE